MLRILRTMLLIYQHKPTSIAAVDTCFIDAWNRRFQVRPAKAPLGRNVFKNKCLWPEIDVENRFKEAFLGCG
jgi:hypothetical protein